MPGRTSHNGDELADNGHKPVENREARIEE